MFNKIDLSPFVTKADLHKELHLLTWRFLGLLTALFTAQTTVLLGAMYYLINNSHSK
jgi:hypothetical protein